MFEAPAELYNLVVTVFFRGGWIPFVLLLVWMFFRLYMNMIWIRWFEKQEWVFLKISAPEENEKSPLAFEQIFNHLHSIQTSRNWSEVYIEGQFQLWFTWEIASIGGKISYHVKLLKKHRDTLEAAVYSQYPDAEIEEAEDYFEHLPHYDPDKPDYDIYAFSWKLVKDDAYPIRTYLDFEHSTADTFVDPITGIWEELTKLNEYEMFVIQYIFVPETDNWKERGYRLVSKLKGEPQKGSSFPINLLKALFDPILDAIIRPTPPEGRQQREEPPSLMLHLSEGEKKVIEAVEKNLAKLGYSTKVRCLYLAPPAVFNTDHVTSVIGGFKAMGASDLNSLKPNTDKWTKIKPIIKKDWERKLAEFRLKWRKRKLMSAIRRRSFYGTPEQMILNTEEIATILHFPSTEVTVPEIQKVPVAKEKAPADLPIVTDFEV